MKMILSLSFPASSRRAETKGIGEEQTRRIVQNGDAELEAVKRGPGMPRRCFNPHEIVARLERPDEMGGRVSEPVLRNFVEWTLCRGTHGGEVNVAAVVLIDEQIERVDILGSSCMNSD